MWTSYEVDATCVGADPLLIERRQIWDNNGDTCAIVYYKGHVCGTGPTYQKALGAMTMACEQVGATLGEVTATKIRRHDTIGKEVDVRAIAMAGTRVDWIEFDAAKFEFMDAKIEIYDTGYYRVRATVSDFRFDDLHTALVNAASSPHVLVNPADAVLAKPVRQPTLPRRQSDPCPDDARHRTGTG